MQLFKSASFNQMLLNMQSEDSDFGCRTRCSAARQGGLRLVALTGYGLPADVRRAPDAGFDLRLINPCAWTNWSSRPRALNARYFDYDRHVIARCGCYRYLFCNGEMECRPYRERHLTASPQFRWLPAPNSLNFVKHGEHD
jgi:hypothetical protein